MPEPRASLVNQLIADQVLARASLQDESFNGRGHIPPFDRDAALCWRAMPTIQRATEKVAKRSMTFVLNDEPPSVAE